MTTNTMQLKLINIEIVKLALKNSDSATKMSLAAETGLSTATCGNILEELLESGEVTETSQRPSTGGRPSRQFIFNKNYAFVCSVYLRKEAEELSIFSSISNLNGEPVAEKLDHPEVITIKTLIKTMEENLKNFPLIKTVCFGIPGIVSHGAIESCDLPELEGVNLQAIMTDRFKITVIAENDMNATAVGFINNNDFNNPENLAYIYYPDKGLPGCGIIVNGRILNGASNFAGEVAFLPLGVPVSELAGLQKNKTSFIESAAKTIASINCIVNPEKIILAGKFIKEIEDSVRASVSKLIPVQHIPELRFITDIHQNYTEGLTSLALEEMSGLITVTKKTTRNEI